MDTPPSNVIPLRSNPFAHLGAVTAPAGQAAPGVNAVDIQAQVIDDYRSAAATWRLLFILTAILAGYEFVRYVRPGWFRVRFASQSEKSRRSGDVATAFG